MTIATSRDRVPDHTAESVNHAIEQETLARLRSYAQQRERIAGRLKELDAEWDIERAIEANASTIAFIGVVLGYFVSPYWLLLPALVTAFLFQHAIQGWCPPVPVLRRLGFRTVYEIERERYALKVLRGDFVDAQNSPERAFAAVRL